MGLLLFYLPWYIKTLINKVVIFKENIMNYLMVGFAGVLFYLIFPGIGAVLVRKKWRVFRKNLIDSSFFPLLDYGAFRQLTEGRCGSFRFFGSLEAIQGDDLIWIRGNNLLASVEMSRVNLFVLQLDEENLGDLDPTVAFSEKGKITSLSWQQIFSLPEGTSLFVSGSLCKEAGKALFSSAAETPLTMIIYEGRKENLLGRAIWGGRQRNEYWNVLTPGALAVGFFSLLVMGNYFLNQPNNGLLPVVTMALSLVPFSIILPPGLLFYLLYRKAWKKGRLYRSERDLLRLPLRYFEGSLQDGAQGTLPDGSIYRCELLSLKKEDLISFDKGAFLRSSMAGDESRQEQRGYAFGVVDTQDHKKQMTSSSDPFAEYVIVPGNPEAQASLSEKKALKNEILSIGFILTGLLLNTYIMLIVLQRFLY